MSVAQGYIAHYAITYIVTHYALEVAYSNPCENFDVSIYIVI